MRLVSLLLLLALAAVFLGLGTPYSAFAAAAERGCCDHDAGEEERESAPSPCNAAECPCAFCLPAVLEEAIALAPPEKPLPARSSPVPSHPLNTFPDRIEYPPESV